VRCEVVSHPKRAVAPTAPLTDDIEELSRHLKAGLYFLDSDMAGCGAVDADAWTGERYGHHHCVLVLISHTRELQSSAPGDEWIDGTRQCNADLRAAEPAVITASYLCNLGSQAVAHTPSASHVDIELLALRAGLVDVRGSTLRAPR